MTKQDMLSEVKFPIYQNEVFNFKSYDLQKNIIIDAWILCFIKIENHTRLGIYKWQKENNPYILAYTYIKIDLNDGPCRYIQDPQFHHDKVIIIRNEKDKDLILS